MDFSSLSPKLYKPALGWCKRRHISGLLRVHRVFHSEKPKNRRNPSSPNTTVLEGELTIDTNNPELPLSQHHHVTSVNSHFSRSNNTVASAGNRVIVAAIDKPEEQ